MEKILSDISLKKKLQFLTFLPVLGLLYFISLTILDTYNEMANMQRLSKLVDIDISISTIANDLSKERSYTSEFISSDGKKYKNKLYKIREKVDNDYTKALKLINNIDFDNYLKATLLKVLKERKNLLDKVRYQIRENNLNNVKTINALNFYTGSISKTLGLLLEISNFSQNAYITRKNISKFNLLSAKDNAELIVSYGLNLLNEVDKDEIDKQSVSYNQARLKTVILSEKEKIDIFLKSSTKDIKDMFEKYMKQANLDEYNSFVQALANDKDLDLYAGENDRFLKLSLVKTNLMDKIVNHLTNDIKQKISYFKNNARNEFIKELIVALILVVISLLLGYIIYNKISKDMNLLKNNLLDFISFIAKEKKDISISDVQGSDEFAVIINHINKQVQKAKDITQKDNAVLSEIDDVIHRVENGFFTYKITREAGSKEVELLKANINSMINSTKNKLDMLDLILASYGKYKYNFKLKQEQQKGMAGDVGTLSTSLLALGEDISMFMATFSNISEELTKSTEILLKSSNELSNSTNKQAVSLEQTASSIDEIVDIVKHNFINIENMSQLSNELAKTASDGENLANNTVKSMEEINEKVNKINEAIGIIEQIAFQTNILSLNAAVEAATAGEAGKGFAVVAGEVRNLASRSADAANEIKKLVQDASIKANEGKDISFKMIQGYGSLSEKINQTNYIIKDVAKGSKEQQTKIEQINKTVNQLDIVTQQNANSANRLNEISNSVAQLSKYIEKTISQAEFDKEYKNMVCDANLSIKISGYKRDHINFKKSNFENLSQFRKFNVVDHTSCKMGRWILESEQQGKKFTKLSKWKELKEVHKIVHQNVQKYINDNANRASLEELSIDAHKIEDDTAKVFSLLNQILKDNCQDSNI